MTGARTRYVAVLLREEGGTALPYAVAWIQWAKSTGRHDAGPVLGPVPFPLDPLPAMTTTRIEWLLAAEGYRIAGPWSYTPQGMVAWIELAAARARAGRARRHAPARRCTVSNRTRREP